MAGLMIYGAYGYTGELIARRAVEMGLKPILAGRDPARTRALADELGLEARVVGLDDPDALARALEGVDAVIHTAGPFADTWRPMTSACLATGTHYLDITGEPDVLQAILGLDAQAKAAGIVVMPGTGFDVVPTDCVAAMLKERLPDATRLRLAFGNMRQASRGTTRTMLRHIDKPMFVRRDGKIVPREGDMVVSIDFGDGPVSAHALSWGDIVTAAHTTGIQSVEVFIESTPEMGKLLNMPVFLRRLLASPLGRPLAALQLRTMPPGPNEHRRTTGRTTLYGRVENDAGDVVELRMETAEGYQLTSHTAVKIAAEVLAGKVGPGFHTPAGAMGAEFILGIDGTVLKD